LTREQWEAHPGERNPGKLHDGTPVELYLPFFKGVLDDALKRYE
jgi:hypothetical protein